MTSDYLRAFKYTVILCVCTTVLSSFAPAVALQPVDTYKLGDLVDVGPLPSLEGGRIDIASFRNKKVVVVGFWLPTCDRCLDQLELLSTELKKKKRDRDVVFFSVTPIGKNESSVLKNVLDRKKLKITVLHDEDLIYSRKCAATVIPSFVLIDRAGGLASPVIHSVDEPVRDINLIGMIDLLRSGDKIPEIQFFPYTENKMLRSMIGKPAPDFQLKSRSGGIFSIKDNINRRNVIVLFWHPYKPTAVRLIKNLKNIYTPENKDKYKINILAVSSIYGPSQLDELEKLEKDNQPGFPFLIDDGITVGKSYNVDNIPAIFIVDGKGIVRDAMDDDVSDIQDRALAVLKSLKALP